MLKRGLFILVLAIVMLGFGLPVKSEAAQGLVNGLASKRVTDNFVNPPTDVYVNPGGQGQALIYGYYNARNGLDFIKVVNTSTTLGVAAKVRFREGKNSNEIRDFFICLSAADEWSGWVVGDASPTSVASLVWWDNDTPTFPDPQGDNDVTNNFDENDLSSLVAIPFADADGGAAPSVSADDTKEGELEIIAVSAWPDTPGATKVVATPNECGWVLGQAVDINTITAKWISDFPGLVLAPNSLMGTAYIFQNGTYAYNATALADFESAIVASPGLNTDDPPRLSSGTDNNGNLTSLDEVNFALTKYEEDFLYDIQSTFKAGTTLVETFPTKRATIDAFGSGNPFNPLACIADDGSIGTVVSTSNGPTCSTTVTTQSTSNGRCVEVNPTIWNDAELKPGTTTGFSPGETSKLVKCDEVNLVVVGQNAESLVDSNLVQFNLTAPSGFNFGWISIGFGNTGTTINGVTMLGLPVITYEMQGYIEGGLSHMLEGKFKTNYTALN